MPMGLSYYFLVLVTAFCQKKLMRMKRYLTSVIYCLTVALASGQDRCGDVLANGTFKWAKVKDNSYFQQIVWSRFLRSTYQSSKTDKDAGFGVPIGEIVLGGNYTEEQYKAKKDQIEEEYFNQINSSREIDVAMSSGDEEVLKAWSQCMSNRGGLALSLEVVSPTKAFLTIQYYPQGTRNSDKLDSNIKMPEGVQVTDGAKYLRKGALIVAGNPRTAVLTFPDASTTAEFVVNGKESSDKVWLPARLKRMRQTKSYNFGDEHRLYGYWHKQVGKIDTTVKITSKEIEDGWTFDPTTAQTNLQQRNANKASVGPAFFSVTPYTFYFGYSYNAPNRHGGGRDGGIEGFLNPHIIMQRDVWVPSDVKRVTTDTAKPSIAPRRGFFHRLFRR